MHYNMDKLTMQTANGTKANVEKIAALFPNCVTETIGADGKPQFAVDFDQLRQELSSAVVEGHDERYQFTWPDKKKAILAANAPISATLRPCREESVDFDNTKNLYIEGDNLDVLKCLKETYSGKVKMIYIDPPYNTGNDFVYEDDFAQSADEYLANSGQFDDQGNRLVTNTESNGRFHTDWLNMMYPRLKVARDLLTEDGVICISLDDHEIQNLQNICNELFGERNRVALFTLMSNPRGSQNSKLVSSIHEYILIYCKNISLLELKGLGKDDESLAEFKEIDEQGRKYRLLGLRKRGGAWRMEDRPNMYFPIYVNPKTGQCSLESSADFSVEVLPKRPTGELSRWTWGKEKFASDCKFVIGRRVNRAGDDDAWDIFRKDYIDNEDGEVKTTKVKTIWDEKETNYQNAKNEIKALFGNSEVFDFPKPTYIIQKLASILYWNKEDVMIDFFSGSSSSAQAMFQFSAIEQENHRFIMVQIPEQITDTKSEAYKAGYRTICEIGKERVRRAGVKIKEENSEFLTFDSGFRVLKLDSSNMLDVFYEPQEVKQQDLFGMADNIKSDRTPEDLLFQVMLELGVMLDSKIVESTFAGKKMFNVADGFLLACFDKDVNDAVITDMAKQQPAYAVLRDSSYADDSTATNFEQIFKTYSPNTIIKAL